MFVDTLIDNYTVEKNHSPSHVNELLDYLQAKYIYSEISIKEYKQYLFELDKLNAEKPSFS